MARILGFISHPDDPYTPPLPLPITGAFWVFLKIHQIWKWKLHTLRVLESSQSTMSYFAGVCVQQMGVDKGLTGIPVRWLAQLTLVCDCYIRTRRQYENTCDNYYKLTQALAFKSIAFVPMEKQRHPCPTLLVKILGPSKERWLHYQILKLAANIRCAAVLALQLFADIFSLSQYSLLLIESFSWNEETEVSAVRNFFLNAQTVLTELSENKKALKGRLIELEPIFEHYLRMDISPIVDSASSALDLTDEILEGHEELWRLAMNVGTFAANVTRMFGKRVLRVGSFFILDKVPEALKEDLTPPPRFGQIKVPLLLDEPFPKHNVKVLPIPV